MSFQVLPACLWVVSISLILLFSFWEYPDDISAPAILADQIPDQQHTACPYAYGLQRTVGEWQTDWCKQVYCMCPPYKDKNESFRTGGVLLPRTPVHKKRKEPVGDASLEPPLTRHRAQVLASGTDLAVILRSFLHFAHHIFIQVGLLLLFR